MTNQPSYWCIKAFREEQKEGYVLIDRKGTYDPVLLFCQPVSEDQDNEPLMWRVAEIEVEPLTLIKDNSSLCDNRFHTDHPAWFGTEDHISSVARFVGESYKEILDKMLSSCPVTRAEGYSLFVDYFGSEQFDQCSRLIHNSTFTKITATLLDQIEQSESWHEGYGFSFTPTK